VLVLSVAKVAERYEVVQGVIRWVAVHVMDF
jgi:hypothetical protein